MTTGEIPAYFKTHHERGSVMHFVRLLTAAALSIGAAFIGSPIAQADTQSINCTANVLDATDSQGVDTAFLERELSSLKSVAPMTDVYVQAYQDLPGGNAGSFWKAALLKCSNWRDADSGLIKSNVLVAAYGVDGGDFSLHYGRDFAHSLMTYDDEFRKPIYIELANLNGSSGDLDHVTSGLVQVLLGTSFYVRSSPHSSNDLGIYMPPAYVNEIVEEYEFEPFDFAVVLAVSMLLVAGGGLIILMLAPIGRRLKRHLPEGLLHDNGSN